MTPALDALARDLDARLKGDVALDVSLSRYTTYRLGGPARLFVEPADVDDVLELARQVAAADERPPVLPLGRGSNLVVADRGWPGVVVHLGASFSWIRSQTGPAPDDVTEFSAGAATSLPMLANWAARRGLSGLEFGVGVPGSVGGAVRMNAGAHGMDTSQAIVCATVLDLRAAEVVTRDAPGLGFSYRKSNLRDDDVVVDVRWRGKPADPAEVRARTEDFRRHRAKTQPPAVQNAGSVFKNPAGDAAGRLVEQAGLKGERVGGASVSSLHANFFIADPGASAQDVFDLVREVRRRVADEHGVELEPEIRFVGDFDRSDNGVLTP